MSARSKFLFDTEFGSQTASPKKIEKEEEVVEPVLPPAIYTEEDKERLCREAYEQGTNDGRQEALGGLEASATEAMNSLNDQLQQLSQSHNKQMENIRCEAASLAFAIAKKLSPALIARQPEAEVLKMIESCLGDLRDEPRIVLRASEPVCDALATCVNDLAASTGFQGNIILLPDDTKTNSDCRIEWADGGVDREITDTTVKLEEIINRFINSGSDLG